MPPFSSVRATGGRPELEFVCRTGRSMENGGGVPDMNGSDMRRHGHLGSNPKARGREASSLMLILPVLAAVSTHTSVSVQVAARRPPDGPQTEVKVYDVGKVDDAWLPVVVENVGTPQTRTLTPEEADAVLERDWLFQADECPTIGRARREIRWARELAARLVANGATDGMEPELTELTRLETRCGSLHPQMPSHRRNLPDGLVACWAFDGQQRAASAEERGHEGATSLVEQDELPAGVFGGGLLLGGRHLVNTGPDLSALAGGNYTLCAWIKTRSPTGDFLSNGVSGGCLLLQTYQGVAKGHHWTREKSNVLPGKTQVCDGRWHHIAQVADGDSLLLYVDGRLDAKMLLEGTRTATDAPMLIGSRSVTDTNWRFRGTMDDVCFFARALTADELAGMFAEGAEAAQHVDTDAWEIYLAVRRLKRRIAFRNPLLDFSSVLFIDQPYPRGGAWTHQAIHRLGHRAVPGGRLLRLDGLHPGGTVRTLYPEKPGSFWRPDVSFDGRRTLFCYKAADEKSFHLFEANVDGSGIRQITDSEYDDVDPIYMPDGRIVFTTTRGNSYVRCGPFIYSYVLARCDADGANLYLISTNSEPDFVPSLMRDGRIIYSRWEYTDKALWRVQSLWTTNPDGTGTAVFWGNQSVWPDHVAEPRQIPGSQRVMFTGVGHHDWFSGSIGIIDPTKGRNFPDGLTKVTADLRWPECSIPPSDPRESGRYHSSGPFSGYLGAYPLSEEDFLVSARGEGGKFRLYLMDVYGNRELIYEAAHHAWYAVPLRPRSVPSVRPDTVAWPGTGSARKSNDPGVFYSANVYEGTGLAPGSVKYLRVIQQDAKTYSTWKKTFRHSGPPVSIIQEEAVKRIVSTVPVHLDGSVSFRTPSGQSVYFQALDEHYRALQTMRSFTGLMPGERRGCVGCHELHSTTPPNVPNARALKEAPRELSPPPWGDESIGYERFVQPVLDRHCGTCHQGKGKARKALDLTLRPGVDVFTEPYLTLIGAATWHGGPGVPKPNSPGYGAACPIPVETMDPSQNDPGGLATLEPMRFLSCKSRLIDIAMSKEHSGQAVAPEGLRRLIAWVDACCPYMGDEELRALGDPTFEGIESLPIRPRVQTAPIVPRP